jgi:hypothetical protein
VHVDTKMPITHSKDETAGHTASPKLYFNTFMWIYKAPVPGLAVAWLLGGDSSMT